MNSYQYRIITRGGGADQKAILSPGAPVAREYVSGLESDVLSIAREFNRQCGSPRIDPRHIKATYQVRREPVADVSTVPVRDTNERLNDAFDAIVDLLKLDPNDEQMMYQPGRWICLNADVAERLIELATERAGERP